MNTLNVDLSRYATAQDELAAFDALVESAQDEIAEETERTYQQLYDWEQPMTEEAKQHIRDFAYKKAYFTVIRDKQEDCMNHEIMKFIRVMRNEFEQQANKAGMSLEEYEEYSLNEDCTAE